MDKFLGNFFKGIGKFFEVVIDGIIFVVNLLVTLIDNVRKFLAVFSIFFIFFLLNPFILILNTWILILLAVLFIVPLLGRGLVSFLKYGQYVITEYFYDRADYYLSGKNKKYGTFSEYSNEYKKKKREAEEREYQRRAEAQQKMWEEYFRNFYNSQQGNYYGNYQGDYQGNNNYYNPTNDFVSKYEESCKVLGLEPTTDVYEIKLAYRKMAKKYHPDINHSEDATQKFQKINEAYEFLSEANIKRYKDIKN